MKKSNGLHTKNTSVNSIKKQCSISVRNKNNIKQNNPLNTILNYGYSKKKRNISINPDYVNKVIISNKKKGRKSLEFSIHEIKSLSTIKKNNISIEKKKNINKKIVKSQRFNENEINDKNYNLTNNIFNEENFDKYKQLSDIKPNDKIKFINRASSSISSGYNKKLLKEISPWSISLNKNKKNGNEILINGGNQSKSIIEKKKKSRNDKNNSVTYYKSNSIDNKKLNSLISSSISINIHTLNNGNFKNKYDAIKNAITINKVKPFTKNKNSFKDNIYSNYTQIYLKKSYLRNSIENGMNNRINYNKFGIKKMEKK
jgi:hypothetical protein